MPSLLVDYSDSFLNLLSSDQITISIFNQYWKSSKKSDEDYEVEAILAICNVKIKFILLILQTIWM